MPHVDVMDDFMIGVIAFALGMTRESAALNTYRFSTVTVNGVEEISFDGEPIIRLWPIKVKPVFDGEKYVTKFTRPYQVLTGDKGIPISNL